MCQDTEKAFEQFVKSLSAKEFEDTTETPSEPDTDELKRAKDLDTVRIVERMVNLCYSRPELSLDPERLAFLSRTYTDCLSDGEFLTIAKCVCRWFERESFGNYANMRESVVLGITNSLYDGRRAEVTVVFQVNLTDTTMGRRPYLYAAESVHIVSNVLTLSEAEGIARAAEGSSEWLLLHPRAFVSGFAPVSDVKHLDQFYVRK
jgi:hypothetical protein